MPTSDWVHLGLDLVRQFAISQDAILDRRLTVATELFPAVHRHGCGPMSPCNLMWETVYFTAARRLLKRKGAPKQWVFGRLVMQKLEESTIAHMEEQCKVASLEALHDAQHFSQDEVVLQQQVERIRELLDIKDTFKPTPKTTATSVAMDVDHGAAGPSAS